MAALDVLTLVKAKDHLNIPAGNTQHDSELTDMIGSAVERVERHLGKKLVDAATSTASELLATKVVLAEYWRTQRAAMGGRAGYGTRDTGLQDTGPASGAPLEVKLTEILGPPPSSSGATPRGSFPSASPWPDPADRCVRAAW